MSRLEDNPRYNLMWRKCPWEYKERAGQRCRAISWAGEGLRLYEFDDGARVIAAGYAAIKPPRINWNTPRTQAMRLRLYEAADYTCARCLTRYAPKTRNPRVAVRGLHIDHILPVARGGGNDERNLQVLCEPCNQRKWCNLEPDSVAA